MEAPACLRTLPGAIRGRVLHHPSLPQTAFQHPFPSNSFKNNNNKTQLGGTRNCVMGADSRRKPGDKQGSGSSNRGCLARDLQERGFLHQGHCCSWAPLPRGVPQAVPSRVTLSKVNHGCFLDSFIGGGDGGGHSWAPLCRSRSDP